MKKKVDDDLYTFSISWRVRFDEIDVQGIVHHSEIVKYLEIARIEYWRHLGIGYGEFRVAGFDFVVAGLECIYLKPLYFDKIIRVKARAEAISRASMTFQYLIYDCENRPAVWARTRLVCVKVGHSRPHPMPLNFPRQVIAFEKPGSIEDRTGISDKDDHN